jgi:hypothetical protein
MATRNMTLVIDRRHAEEFSEGFAVEPQKVSNKSYVNMYMHHDGYPEWRGVELANWVQHMQIDQGFKSFSDGSRIASHLVKDFHYDSQYLYPDVSSIDHEYTWIIWTGKSDVWISAYNQYKNTCVFVGQPQKLIDKYEDKQMGYTDWKDKNNNYE